MQILLLFIFLITAVFPGHAIAAPAADSKSKPAAAAPANLFAEQFYLSPAQRVDQQSYVIEGFAFLETPDSKHNSRYSIVTDFGKTMVKSRVIPNLQTVPDVQKWLKENIEVTDYEGVQVRRLILKEQGKADQTLYWVGQKSFATEEKVKQEIEQVKALVQAQGGDLARQAKDAEIFFRAPEKTETTEIGCGSNCQREEKLMLNLIEKMDFGDKLFGPFEGETSGEPIIWRSFGETAWRKTVFESETYSAAVGYWTNQLVFQGFKFPLNTINPFVEWTVEMDSSTFDYKSKMLGWVGLEWRPLARNAMLSNYQPWGIPLLQWVKNYRVYGQYGNRWNVKNEIENSRSYDTRIGIDIYYEFGVDLPPIDQGSPVNVPDYLREYVWGEYYGNYFWDSTGFSSEENGASWMANSSLTLGFKTPAVHLGDNVFFDQIVLMPYMRFEHVNNDEFSFPYQNRYFVAAGLRWMPFRTYAHKNNEWLAKIRVFGEYAGIGGAQNWKQNEEAPNATTNDLMFGVKFSSNRY